MADANAVWAAFRAWVAADPDERGMHSLALFDDESGHVQGDDICVMEWHSFAEAVERLCTPEVPHVG